MRRTALLIVAAAVVCLWPGGAVGQSPMKERVRIDRVRVGFPSAQPIGGVGEDGRDTPVYKAGFWTPVYVDITAGILGLGLSEAEQKYKFEVVVETTDSDGIANNFVVPLRPLEKRESRTVLAYARSGNTNPDGIVVSLRERKLDEETGRNIPGCPSVKSTTPPENPDHIVYLMIGSRSLGLRQSLRTDDKGNNSNRNVLEHTAYIDNDIEQMPKEWWGYEGVDLVILSTSNRSFVNDELLSKDPDNSHKRALADWVRHGGRLVIAAGRNQDLVGQLPELSLTMPVNLKGAMQLPEIRIREFTEAIANPNNPAGQRPPVEVTRLERKPGRAVEVLVRAEGQRAEEDNDEFSRGGLPLIVRGSHGLGQVVVVAFDLDQPPFATWRQQKAFWRTQFLDKLGPHLPASDGAQAVPNWRMYGQNDANDLIVQLQNHLENFEEVPVISFGWVALFIILYIIVVGPLDYFILKKVVKRLELTWITFPTVVLAVSAIAYFTAYWLKGSDLRINKVDVVDIDLQTQQIYGSTWFTIFSPRIQHYTIGVEPAAPEWAKSADDGKPLPAMVTWLGRPEGVWVRSGRTRGQSLFRRAYDYEDRAAGLRGVPIQVWSTKSFTSTYHAPLDPARPLVQVSDGSLLRVGNDRLAGTITWNSPGSPGGSAVELKDALLIYNNKVYTVGTMSPGAAVDLAAVFKPLQMNVEGALLTSGLSRAFSSTHQARGTLNSIAREMLFESSGASKGTTGNTSLRYLDENWRVVGNKDEAILLGCLAPVQGQAEDVTRNPASATRLWLGKLPGGGETRPSLAGNLKQDTYVRVFIPVRRSQ